MDNLYILMGKDIYILTEMDIMVVYGRWRTLQMS